MAEGEQYNLEVSLLIPLALWGDILYFAALLFKNSLIFTFLDKSRELELLLGKEELQLVSL